MKYVFLFDNPRRAGRRLVCAVVLAVCACTVGGLAGRWLWPLELMSHFRPQYAIILTAATGGLLVLRHYGLAAVALVCAGANLFFVAPFFHGFQQTVADQQGGATLRFASLNVKLENRQHDRVLSFVSRTAPDFVALFELNEGWDAAMTELSRDFADSRLALRGRFGLAFFSRYPITTFALREFGGDDVFAFSAQIAIGTQSVNVVGAHVIPPMNPKYFRIRNQQLAELSELCSHLSAPTILIGDLNSTPWSPYFQQLIRDSKLRDGRRGRGFLATWPVRCPPLRIPIDHFLFSPGVHLQGMERGNDIGSDHFPLVVDFSLESATGSY